jgi:O-antigen/teichoic acid export membrane protein
VGAGAGTEDVHPPSWFATERPTRKFAAQAVALIASRGILLGATVAVARIAGIPDFGNFALALVVFQAGLLLRDAGLGQAVIILGGRDPALTWHAFLWVSGLGIALAGLMALAANPVLTLLGLPSGADHLRLLAIAFGVGSLGVVPNASLERNLRFEARAVIDVVAYGSLGVVAVGGAVGGLGITALALGYVAQGAVQATGGILLAPPWRFRGGATSALGTLARYGGILWASALLSYVATNVDNATVGRLGGAHPLGLYALSYTIGNTITISVAQVVNRVALPYYARARNDGQTGADVLRTVLPLSLAAAVVPAVLIIGFAPEIRTALFTADATLVPLVVLTAYGVVRTLGVTMGTAFNGMGLAKIQLRSSTINVVVLVCGVVPGYLLAGPAGVALTVLAAISLSAVYLARHLRTTFAATITFALPWAVAIAVIALAAAWPGGPLPLYVRMPLAAVEVVAAAGWGLRIVLGRSSLIRPLLHAHRMD